jgi:PAS domain S-box-containing protein
MTENMWKATLLSISCIVLFITVYCLSRGITTIFMHLYYIPIVLLSYHYRKKGFFLSVVLSFFYLVLVVFYIPGNLTEIEGAAVRAFVFIGIAALVVYLSENLLQARNNLMRATRIQESIIQNANVWLMVLDSSGRILEWNRAAAELSGYTANEVIGKNEVWKLLYPKKEYRKEITEKITEIIKKDNYLENFRSTITCKDGTEKIILWNTKKIPEYEKHLSSFIAIGVNFTNAVKAEEELAHLAAIVEYSDEAIIGKTLDGIITSWNAGAERIYEYSAQEIVGRNISLLVPPDHPDDTQKILEQIRNGMPVIRYETLRMKKDGGQINVIMTVSPIKDTQNRLIGASTIAYDTTEHRKTNEALAQSEERYRTLAEALPDQIFIVDRDDTMKYVNPAALKLFRLPYNQVIGSPRKSLFPPGIADAQGIMLKKVFETGEPVKTEEKIQFGEQEFWIDTSSVPLKDKEGNVIAVLGIARDITERKHIEKKLLEKELRFRSLFEGAVEGILVADIETKKFMYANPAMCRMLGYSEGELTTLGVENIVPKESLDFAIGEFIAQSRGEKMMSMNIPLLRKDKTILYADISSTHIFIDGGMRSVGFFSDITERRRAEDLLKHFNEELEQKVVNRTEELNKALQEKVLLLREVHHRVKNNLQIIISLINLQMRQIDDKQMKQIMAETQHRVRAMSLVYEKLSQSEKLSQIDLSDYTKFLATQLFSYYGVNFQKVALEIAIEKVMIDINTAIPLGLIINELISNALNHAFPSDRKGTITISSQYENKVLTLVIKDDGIGLPPNLDWKNPESLGLRLVNNLVEQLNGTIKVERELGTTYIISVHREIA